MRHTYEGIGMYVDNWKINPISLLRGRGNREIDLRREEDREDL